jgi:hypothetical protein
VRLWLRHRLVKDRSEEVTDAIHRLLDIGGPPILAIPCPDFLDDHSHDAVAH